MRKSKRSALIYIYIWGNGNLGKAIDCDLRAHGITPSGYVVDDQYANENIISRTYLLNSGKPYAIVRGFEQALLRQHRTT